MEGNLLTAAQRLIDAEANATPCAPIRDLIDTADHEAAYAVQARIEDGKIAAGRRVVGRKIGLTSLAVQKQLGVDQPDFGSLYADCEFGVGLPVPADAFLQPKVEAEMALILGRDIDSPHPGVADVVRAVDYVAPAIEIVASRIVNWDISIVDTIADNASYGGHILGGPVHKLDGLDLRAMRMTMKIDGEEASRGIGHACLGSPLNAAVWLSRKLASLGAPLRAGDVVLTGALGPMVPVKAGTGVEAEIEGLGRIDCQFV